MGVGETLNLTATIGRAIAFHYRARQKRYVIIYAEPFIVIQNEQLEHHFAESEEQYLKPVVHVHQRIAHDDGEHCHSANVEKGYHNKHKPGIPGDGVQ